MGMGHDNTQHTTVPTRTALMRESENISNRALRALRTAVAPSDRTCYTLNRCTRSLRRQRRAFIGDRRCASASTANWTTSTGRSMSGARPSAGPTLGI